MPQLEAWEMVHVSSDFLNTNHGKIECSACHGGDKTAYEKEGAHQGIVALPSDAEATYCSSCHEDIVNKYSVSLK